MLFAFYFKTFQKRQNMGKQMDLQNLFGANKKYDFKEVMDWFRPAADEFDYIEALLSNDEAPKVPSRQDYQEAVRSISYLMKKITDFVYKKKDSELAHDLMIMGGYSFANNPIWLDAQAFFDYASENIGNLPQAEIYKSITTMRNYAKTH